MANELRPFMTASLKELGAAIALGWAEGQIAEVLARLNNDYRRARVLFQYHCDAFERDPSEDHWAELVALMAAYQRLHHRERQKAKQENRPDETGYRNDPDETGYRND